MLEILAPAGSPEGVIAAVQNGADAVYMGFGDHNARMDAKNFTRDEFGRALEYCRIRGVKAYLALNTLVADNEMPQAVEIAKEASRLGADAIIIQDLGTMMAIRQALPDIPIHASTRMGIHNLEGVNIAAAIGIKRVNAAPELSRRKLAYICRHSPIDIGVVVHGMQCMGYGGQCYMSAVTNHSSDNRGKCTRPCRLRYNTVGYTAKRPLSLRDMCLIRYMDDLDLIGVKSVVIEGRSKRPEYAAILTGIYSKAAIKGKIPSHDELRAIQTTISGQGFTDGYYADRQGTDMMATHDVDTKEDSVMFTTARKNYLNGEFQRVPVRFVATVAKGKKVKIAAVDDMKHTAVLYGSVPEPAFHKELTITAMQTQLHKTGGTPFLCAGVKGTVEPGLALPVAAWGDMRRALLAEIVEQRKPVKERAEREFVPGQHMPGHAEPPRLTISVMKAEQLSIGMSELNPCMVYVPVMEIYNEPPALRALLANRDIDVAVSLPRIIHDNEKKNVSDMLSRALTLGITDALVSNIGHIQFAKSHGMNVRGDFGLNVYNSETLRVLRSLGLSSATLSFELRFAEIRDMSKHIDTELIVYGRLPLMVSETCIIKNSTGACTCDSFAGIEDGQGALYPVVPEFGCRNILLNSKKLFLADKRRSTATLGLWAERLFFTTENAVECVAVMKRYMGQSNYAPSGYTRGLYYSGVE
ncbi:MAG: U32 family peptidase [Oscillospiraceae bacterium]|nr:U32 family peptidase [Oscillospiraceae bacterium]